MARASFAVGAAGLMVEVHPNPDQALSDGAQSLTFANFHAFMEAQRPVGKTLGWPVAPPLSQLTPVGADWRLPGEQAPGTAFAPVKFRRGDHRLCFCPVALSCIRFVGEFLARYKARSL